MSGNISVLKTPPASVSAGESDVIVIKDGKVRRRLMAASAALLVFGFALLWKSFDVGMDRTVSMLLTIAGATGVMLAILFYYLSPAKFLRHDVCDAMCATSVEFMYNTLKPFTAGKCTYVPPDPSGDKHTLQLLSGGAGRDTLPTVAGMRVQPRGFGEKDIFIVPPGYGLMEHARRLGATFTDEGLEDEIRDVLANVFELAGPVKVDRKQDSISVELHGVASHALCKSLRKKDPGICSRLGCPLCSFVACAVAEGTGRRVTLDQASARGKTIRLTFSLV